MPLTKEVEFKTLLQNRNRIRVPKNIRVEFHLDPTQTFRVSVHFVGCWGNHEEFYAKVSKDGRITIPELTGNLLKNSNRGQDIKGAVAVVSLCPPIVEEEE